MNNLSLRLRIFISYFLLITLAALVINYVALRQIQETTEFNFYDTYYEKVEIAIDVAEETVATQWEDDLPDTFIHQELAELAEDLELHLMLIDLDGEYVFYDSASKRTDFELSPPEDVIFLLDFAESTIIEVDEATAYEQAESVYSAHYLFYDELPDFILRTGESYVELEQAARTGTITLAIATLLIGAGLLIGLGSWLANALARPLTQLRATAQAMAAGQLETRASTQAPAEISLLAQDFNQMATAVQQMVVEQRAFASNAAHELRTPLTAIRLRTETLLEDEPDAALQQRYLTEIHTEVERLSHLVQDLRLLSRSDAKNLAAGTELVDLSYLLPLLEKEFTLTLSQKQLTYTATINQGNYQLRASTNHMRILLRNLIENAIKYTPDGGAITVNLSQQANTIHFELHDTGIGIAAEDLPQLYQRFFRADKSHNRTIPGSGLGLSLVQAIVNLYNGTIHIHSNGVGQGTTVTLTLPRSS